MIYLTRKMIHKQNRCSGEYVSCIKINGVPILPPLITPERRKELQKYKNEAIETERRLQQVKNFREQEKGSNQVISNNIKKQQLHNRTLEQQISFGDNSHIDVLNTEQKCTKLSSQLMPLNVPTIKVPCKNQNSNLTYNVIDISEYSEDGVRLFSNSSMSDQINDNDLLNTSSGTINLTKNQNSSNTDLDMLEECINNRKPRIRSNSYTLDSPSPALLAHFEKENKKCSYIPLSPKQKNPYLSRHISHWSTAEHNNYVCDNNNSNQLILEDHNKIIDQNLRNEITTLNKNDDNKSLQIENMLDNSIKTSVYVEDLIDEKSSKSNSQISINHEQYSLNTEKNINFKSSDPETELLQILNNIPGDYSKQIIELIEKQKTEQEKRVESYQKLKDQLLSENDSFFTTLEGNPKNAFTIEVKSFNENGNIELQTHNVNSEDDSTELNAKSITNNSYTSSQTLYYTLNSSDENVNTPTGLLIDIDDDYGRIINSAKTDEINRINGNFVCSPKDYTSDLLLINSLNKENVSAVVINCNKELFPENQRLTKQQAASKIGAAIRGYLVRRLMRTERVRNLIQTIKDALLCAMDLHAENSENIKESDVELHRRLIQQVSAACYSFHDVFFSLTIPEQMSVIALDRQRMKEKLKRPTSASSRKSISSSRSTSSIKKKVSKV